MSVKRLLSSRCDPLIIKRVDHNVCETCLLYWEYFFPGFNPFTISIHQYLYNKNNFYFTLMKMSSCFTCTLLLVVFCAFKTFLLHTPLQFFFQACLKHLTICTLLQINVDPVTELTHFLKVFSSLTSANLVPLTLQLRFLY